jgi:hypothetical protein
MRSPDETPGALDFHALITLSIRGILEANRYRKLAWRYAGGAQIPI